MPAPAVCCAAAVVRAELWRALWCALSRGLWLSFLPAVAGRALDPLAAGLVALASLMLCPHCNLAFHGE